MFGYPREHIVGKTIVDFIPAEDVTRLWQSRDSLLAGGADVSDWRIRRSDGSLLPVEVSSTILADGRWLAFVRDISERKRIEGELGRARETDQRLRAELEQVTRASLSVSEEIASRAEPDVPAVLRSIALQAQALTGARGVAIGLGSDPDRLDPWVSLGVSAGRARALGPSSATPGTLRVPIRYRGRITGALHLYDKADAPAFNDRDQRLMEMLAAPAAVAIETAKLYAEEAIQRAWLHATIDQMPEGVILLNRSGRRVEMNRAMLAFSSGDTSRLDGFGNPDIFDLRSPDLSPLP
jgi:PAS domain-containing protein